MNEKFLGVKELAEDKCSGDIVLQKQWHAYNHLMRLVQEISSKLVIRKFTVLQL